jgi:hypothetical protein
MMDFIRAKSEIERKTNELMHFCLELITSSVIVHLVRRTPSSDKYGVLLIIPIIAIIGTLGVCGFTPFQARLPIPVALKGETPSFHHLPRRVT